jgi:hypothetical protein
MHAYSARPTHLSALLLPRPKIYLSPQNGKFEPTCMYVLLHGLRIPPATLLQCNNNNSKVVN